MGNDFDRLTDEIRVIDEHFQAAHSAGWEELKGKECKVKLGDDNDTALNAKFLGLVQSRQGLGDDGLEAVVEVLGLPVLYRMHISWLLF